MEKYIRVILLSGVLLLTASRPLVCWRIGADLQWHRARCWSTEFHALAPNEQPAPVEPTATPEPYTPEPTDVPTATPTEWWTATPTHYEPYPYPTFEQTPYPMYKWVE